MNSQMNSMPRTHDVTHRGSKLFRVIAMAALLLATISLFTSNSAALLLAIAFGVVLALLLEYMDDTVKSPGDTENGLGLPALAVIPIAAKNIDTASVAIHKCATKGEWQRHGPRAALELGRSFVAG